MNPVLIRTPPEHFAARVTGDPYFFASTVAAYQRRHNLEDMALAALLGCTPDVLTHLRLCRRPGAAPPDWTAEADILAIVGRFGCDAVALQRVLEDACPAQW
jgi:hypothetical protein